MKYCRECKPPCELRHRRKCRKWAKIAAQRKAERAATANNTRKPSLKRTVVR